MYKIDLNSDLGESFGSYKIGMDEEIIKCVTSVNVACGWHGGDPVIMEKTVAEAKKSGTEIGAHPSFPDLMGFGRRNMKISAKEAKAYVKYQLGALMAFAAAENVKIQHLKPHGAIYNMAAVDYNLAKAIAQAIYEVDKDIILMAPSGSEMIKAGLDMGLKVASEVFADRGYTKEGTLVPRSEAGAFIEDENEAIERVIRMIKEGKVRANTGEDIDIKADSVCVHGDNPKALAFVTKIREALTKEGIEIVPLKEIVK